MLQPDTPPPPPPLRNGVEAIQQRTGAPSNAPDGGLLLHGLHPGDIQPLTSVHPCIALTTMSP